MSKWLIWTWAMLCMGLLSSIRLGTNKWKQEPQGGREMTTEELKQACAEFQQEQQDNQVRAMLSADEWTPIASLLIQYGWEYYVLVASLKRLMETGEVIRKLDGNERSGHYIYRRTATGHEEVER